MISLSSIWANVLRHTLVLKKDLNLFLFWFYWPLLDIFTWGFLGIWIQQSTNFKSYETISLLGLLLWQIIGRGCNFITLVFYEELYSKNLINIFSLPLRISEWICSTILLYLIMITILSIICLLFISITYKINILEFFSTFFLFSPPFLFFAIWLGFIGLSIIVIFGRRGSELANAIIWALLPFSGAYFPIEVLPTWGQKLSNLFHIKFLFQGMREYVINQKDPKSSLISGYIFGIFYAFFSILLFLYFFNYSKKKGLSRLMN